ncbi:hypothetical protein [Haloechinothrix sp. LS1_15]|uniref:hypothetical protein n=1 Tax=Haloechinothrix sp. LS1_15 TaxID=2652248 RepID=UPI00294731E3|nr:hypothetical protein [Haloechinothrix sp. LS1_15]MDV6013464.1 hypothetical protein [Haloechinothrix sp. LS1_15]
MLYIVLVLVLGALGLLIAALITGASLWAWVSIGCSGAAAVLLVVDWLRRRGGERSVAARQDSGTGDDGGDDVEDGAELGGERDEVRPAGDVEAAETAEGAGREGVIGPEHVSGAEGTGEHPDSEGSEGPGETAEAVGAGDPGEEETDAADLLIVCELDDEVLVVDEHPRYHLTRCRWLGDRDTIPLPVSEARDLGFTPCARCGPDAHLAAGYRESKQGERADG